MEKIVIIGAGGHAKSVCDAIESAGLYEIAAIVASPAEVGEAFLSYRISGTDDELKKLRDDGIENACIAVGSIGNIGIRKKIFERVKNAGMKLPAIIDPSARIAQDVAIAEGVFVGKHVVVNTSSRIGACAIINTSVTVEHDCAVGAFVHIASGAVLCGNVTIGFASHIGAGTTVIQGITIGEESMIGAGSVVVKPIGDRRFGYGNPFKEVSR